MINIGLIGYYGYGNYGDELFFDALSNGFQDFSIKRLYDSLEAPYFNTPVEDKLHQIDAVVIGGGDLVIPWSLSPLYWNPAYLEKPVFIVGVGVPTWQKSSPAVVAKMKEFFSHDNVQLIHCRDKESGEWIKENLNPNADIISGTDLVCSLFNPLEYEPTKSPKAIGLVTRSDQNNQEKQKIVPGLLSCMEKGYSLDHINMGIGQTYRNDQLEILEWDIQPRKVCLPNTISEISEFIKGIDILASQKFHGCVVATMMGKGVLSLSRANKFVNFMRSIEREHQAIIISDERLSDPHNILFQPVGLDKRLALYENSIRELEYINKRIAGLLS